MKFSPFWILNVLADMADGQLHLEGGGAHVC